MNNNARLQLIQHAQIEMATLYQKVKSGETGRLEAESLALIMGRLLQGIRLEIDHYNLISKMPTVLPDYNESVKAITEQTKKP